MVFDVDKLKEAVELWDGPDARHIQTIDRLFDAARMVVAGQPLWWCEKHKSIQRGGGTWCEYAQWKGYGGPPNECRMVEGWWMPTGEVDGV